VSGNAARRLEVVAPERSPAAPPPGTPQPRPSQNGASQNGASQPGASQNGAMQRELRRDLRLIADMIEPRSRVLDIGCGDGALLAHLAREKGVDARGIELRQAGVNVCVRHGLSVIQGDADHDLSAFPDQAFDVVVLSQTLQATHRPRHVVEELLRIGKRAIVSFPNFGFWRLRLGLLFAGRMPVSELLNHPWYETPNIHLCTIRDFVVLVEEIGARIERSVPLDRHGSPFRLNTRGRLANLLAEQGVFVLSRTG
jgi:methionine biosynthesis protein MetW